MMVPPPTAATGFDWRTFFALAERLAHEVDDEAALRSAISRAYYAVFALASRRLRDDGCLSPRRDQHTRVWAIYRNGGKPACERIGDRGFNLLDQRRRADYRDRIGGVPEKQVRLALDRAREILDLLDRLDPTESCCPPAAPAPGPGSP